MTEESASGKLTLSKKSTLTLKNVNKPAASDGKKVVQVEVRKKRVSATAAQPKVAPKVEIDEATAQKLKLLAEAKEYEAKRKQEEEAKEEKRKKQKAAKEEALEQKRAAEEAEKKAAEKLKKEEEAKAKAQEEEKQKQASAGKNAAKQESGQPVSEHKVKKSKDYDDEDEDEEEYYKKNKKANAASEKHVMTREETFEQERKKIQKRSFEVQRRNNKINVNNYMGGGDDDDDDYGYTPHRRFKKKQPKPVQQQVQTPQEKVIKEVIIPETITVQELANRMAEKSTDVIKRLMSMGVMATINQAIDADTAQIIVEDMGHKVKRVSDSDVEEGLTGPEDTEADLLPRAPIVTVMGHVDHGKTSLLDAIRQSDVTEHEAGGITQHIGAYVVRINGEKITFLDTPGHEAFTSMRMRGAQSTDIAILVVAADDGVMPQTIEAINHAKAAGVEIIVAVNKIDKEGANIDRVKQELSEYELIPEEWGGSTVFCPVSAHTKEGIENLLEMIVLTSEVLELKANPKRQARGIVIEARLDKGRGPVATVLVQKGTLNIGDHIAVGTAHGKVRAMLDHNGERVKLAKPSTPVEILGLNGVPDAGEIFVATENDKEAKQIAQAYIDQGKDKLIEETKSKKLSLDGLFDQIQAGNVKDLNLIIKADVQGSVEAVKQSLVKLSNEEVAVRVIHGGVGAINESDVTLASASNAIIIGFNVRVDNTAKDTADRENVDVRLYRVIYDAIEDIESAMKGMLEPIYEEKVIAHAEVRQTFKASGVGIIAGSYVLDGKIERGCRARISRDGEQLFEGNLASLKRFKDDVKEVNAGYECGLVFEGFNDLQEADQIECYKMVEVPR